MFKETMQELYTFNCLTLICDQMNFQQRKVYIVQSTSLASDFDDHE